MARFLSIFSIFTILVTVSTAQAHELTTFENFLITYITPANLLLLGCALSGVACVMFLSREIIERLKIVPLEVWEIVLYILGTLSIIFGYVLSNEKAWIFGLTGCLLVTGAFELSDRFKRWYMNRIRFYILSFVVWSVTTLLYQHFLFGLVAAGSLFMVITINIENLFKRTEEVTDSKPGLNYVELDSKVRRERDSWLFFLRDTISALCLLVALMFLQMSNNWLPSFQVLTTGLLLVGGIELVFDLLYISLKDQNLEYVEGTARSLHVNPELKKRVTPRYRQVQIVAIAIAFGLVLMGYTVTKVPDLALVGLAFLTIYLPVKLYDFLDSEIWTKFITLVWCIVLGTIVYIYKDAISTLTFIQLYDFLHL